MREELLDIMIKDYNGIENYVLKEDEGVGFTLSYTDELNMGSRRTKPFFIPPEFGEYTFDSVFKLNADDVVISGFLGNDKVLIYSLDVTDSEGRNSYVGTIREDTTKLYVDGPDKAFEKNTIEYVKEYVNNVVEHLKEGKLESVDYKELSKFVFEELKYRYKVV